MGWVIGISLSISILLTLADYQVQNISFPLFDDSALMAWVDLFCEERMDAKKDFFDEGDVTYVNFGKDKTLVPVVDEYNDTIGNDVITDREKLLEFLELANKSKYKYIFLDVRFEKGYETPYDSALFSLIKTMPRLIIATHRGDGGYEIIDSTLLDKSAYADYRGTFFSGFTRYEFLQDGSRSVALQMYHDLDGKDIHKGRFGFTTSKGWPCYNLKYIPLPYYLCTGKSEASDDSITFIEEMRYKNVGHMVLNRDYYTEENVFDFLLNDKIVVVGDFDDDLHGTYVGEVPGPVLSLAAYKYLKKGLHKLSWWYVTLLLLIYFLISFFTIISLGHVANFFENRPVLHCFIALLGLPLFFLILKVFLYRVFLISMVVFVPTIVFWILTTLSFIQYEKHNNK